MTVTYTAQVASCKRFGCFWKLLFRWKGSIYKLLWPNLTVYIILYSTLSLCYRFFLDEHQQTNFEKLSLHCQTYGDLIPVPFVLGFYISIVVKRWWDQYLSIPWPDPLAVLVSAFLWGQDERSRLMRRTVMRYANLSLVLTLRMMCPSVKKRFPTLDHMVEAGFMLPSEKKIFDKLEERTPHPKYWLPLVWSIHILNTARREDRIREDFGLNTLINGVNSFRSGCGSLLNFDWISIPLVYSQVVTLAVYTYFLATLMGNQYLNPKKGYANHSIDLVVPIFTLLQFFFYMGWLLVAETLVNPFGEDDDDFEVNWLIDRNLQISYLIVDEVHEDYPELIKDQYWEEVIPTELPYTEAAKQYYTEPFLGSTRDVDVPLDQRGFILMSMLEGSMNSVSEKDCKKTTPVQIGPILTPIMELDSNASSPRIAQSSNSILHLLKKNIYGDNSKRSISSTDLDAARRKSMALSRMSGSPGYSVASTFKRNFNDFPEDIFWMSDFSVVEPRQKFYRCPQATDIETGPLINNIFPLERIPCAVAKQNLKTKSVMDQYTRSHERSRPTSYSWHGPEIPQGQGQGEQITQSIGLRMNKNLDHSSSLCTSIQSDLACSPTRSRIENERVETMGQLGFSDESIKEVKKDIVLLDQQILLEEQVNLPEGHEKSGNVNYVLNPRENAEAPISEQIISSEGKVFKISRVSSPMSFDKPAPTPAIVIPGSIMLNDHLTLPLIEQDSSPQTAVPGSPTSNPSTIETAEFLHSSVSENLDQCTAQVNLNQIK